MAAAWGKMALSGHRKGRWSAYGTDAAISAAVVVDRLLPPRPEDHRSGVDDHRADVPPARQRPEPPGHRALQRGGHRHRSLGMVLLEGGTVHLPRGDVPRGEVLPGG